MKVLVADDETISRRLLESSLKRWGYEVALAEDGCQALRILQAPDSPQLVVFDWLMPGLDGTQLCREVRSRKQEPYTYILLLTAKRAQEDIVEGLTAGADDYITKPFNPQELRVRLRAGKRILYLQDQLIASREALRAMAMHDSLTKLWNRAAILDVLTNEVCRSQRQGLSVGVILADLDHFKAINDTYGHLAGDAVLREVANVMRSTTRPYDAVGRHGGEEFLIVLPGCDQINAASHAERLRTAISQVSIETPEGPARVTVSMGVAVSSQEPVGDVYGLIRMADEALYRAKRLGRNRVECAQRSEADPAAVGPASSDW
ncbi:MAG: diguanylate cyclase [Planctomycetia bacterium]|nr:diguanylate cyclase [Planctomycetia bacterium]